MTPTELLLRTKNLIRDPRAWIKGAAKLTEPDAPGGYGYCLTGALAKAAGQTQVSDTTITGARHRLRQVVGDRIEDWNDAGVRTHDDVLDAIDTAIALERKARSTR